MAERTVTATVLVLLLSLCSIEALSSDSNQLSHTDSVSFYGAVYPHQSHPSSSLHMCLHLTASQGNLLNVLTTRNQTFNLQLSDNTLSALLLSQHDPAATLLSLNISASHLHNQWLKLELNVTQHSIFLALGDTTVSNSLEHTITFSEQLFFGGSEKDIQSSKNFVGCLSNVSINSQFIAFPEPPDVGYHHGCCVPPRKVPPNHEGVVNWGEISVEPRELVVDEGASVIVSDANLVLSIPRMLVDSLTGPWYRDDLMDRIVFEVVNQSENGSLFRGDTQVWSFHYSELNVSQITYNRSEGPKVADSVLLRAHFECQDGSEGPWSQELALPIRIVLKNTKPYHLHGNTLTIANGTRRIITPDILTVRDRETDPALLQFEVLFVRSQECGGMCVGMKLGRVEKTDSPGLEIKYFNQRQINRGEIAFQHFGLNKSMSKFIIGLKLSDGVGGKLHIIHPQITVQPQLGQISFTPLATDCMFLEIGDTFTLSPLYLNTTTNFEDQDPEISYDVVAMTTDGIIEVYDPLLEKWSLVNETRASHSANITHFTQSDVNRGFVRYTHNTVSECLMLDRLSFHLRSTKYTQPNLLEEVCFNCISDDLLVHPRFVTEPHELTLAEGSSARINADVISVALSDQHALYDSFGGFVDIRIDQLKPIFTLEEVPTTGSLVVNRSIIRHLDSFSLADLRNNLVEYQHNGQEVHTDSFTVRVHSTVDVPLIRQPDPSDPITVTISVEPVNDNPPTRWILNTIFVTEGSMINITPDHISVEDADRPRDTITVIFRKSRSEFSSIGHFAFTTSPNKPITRCTMDDITQMRVMFVHTSTDPNAMLSYLQYVKFQDGKHKQSRPFPSLNITAVPHTLEVKPPVLDNECLMTLDLTTQRSQVLSFSRDQFVMHDQHGSDSNLVNMVTVSVENVLQYGRLLQVVNGNQAPVSTFTVHELIMGRIQYEYTHSDENTLLEEILELNFRYGHTLTTLPAIKICIIPIPILDTIHIQTAHVSNNGLSTINSTHLWANDTRGDSGDHIGYEIVVPPQYGTIVNQSNPAELPLVNFTQTDLDHGHIGYDRPLTHGREPDQLMLRVCSRVDVCSESLLLSLPIHYIPLIINNPGINVTEGDNYTLTLEDLNVIAPSGYSTVTFHLSPDHYPAYGALVLNNGPDIAPERNPKRFSVEDIQLSSIEYRSDIKYEVLMDSFKVQIRTQLKSDPSQEVNVDELVKIRIIPVDDNDPQIVDIDDHLTVARGGSLQITRLSASDFDSDVDDRNLMFSSFFAHIRQGYLYLKPHNTRVTTWLQSDVWDGNLFYKAPDSDEHQIDYIFLRIEGYPNTGAFIIINIVDIIFEKVSELELTINEGGTGVIDVDYLQYRATNDDTLLDSDIVYHLTSDPTEGKLYLHGRELTAPSNFSQQAVASGELYYEHNHNNTQEDKFQFTLGDNMNRNSDEEFSFTIHIKLIDDDPPEVVISREPVLVLAMSMVIITNKTINVTDLDTAPPSRGADPSAQNDDIICTVVKPPRYGVMRRQRFGQPWKTATEFTKFDLEEENVIYNSTLSGTVNDSFSFTVSDHLGNSDNVTYQVEIVILPERVGIEIDENFVVEEDQREMLERSHFKIKHFYLREQLGIFLIKTPPTKGYLLDTQSGERDLANFTTDQLREQSLYYVHYGEEDVLDSFEFMYQSANLQGLVRESDLKLFEIIINPVNDQPPTLDPQREQTFQLWAGEVRNLTQTYLNASDGDSDSTEIHYHIFYGQVDSYMAFANNTERSITTFTQEDVNQGRIVFVHGKDPSGDILYNVTDGEFETAATFSYESDPLMLFCDYRDMLWEPLSVGRLETVQLSFNNLRCDENDVSNDREIDYMIDSGPQFGQFLIDNQPVSAFTKALLQQGLVSYRHTNQEEWEVTESVNLTIETDFSTSIRMVFNISLVLPRVEPGTPAINTGLTVIEGGSACFNLSSLDARNVRYQFWQSLPSNARPKLVELGIRFLVYQIPTQGYISVGGNASQLQFTHSDLAHGVVCYHHSGSEMPTDVFHFMLVIEGPSQRMEYPNAVNFSIAVTPVNDLEPTLNTPNPSALLVEGFTKTLNSTDLEVVDGDTNSDEIMIFLTALSTNAKIMVGKRELSVGEGFSQTDVNAGRVTLEPTAIELSYFIFHFTDQNESLTDSIKNLVNFTVEVEEHTLHVMGNQKVTFQQNQNLVLITEHSLNSRTNGHDSETKYIITKPPTRGDIIELAVPHQFTQRDIVNHVVRYVPRAYDPRGVRFTGALNDSFLVNITNRNLVVANVEVSVHILVWGKIKQNTSVDFSSSESMFFKLPEDILTLERPSPTSPIRLIDPPKYGFLDLQFAREPSKRSSTPNMFEFHYDDLQNGWVYYVWTHSSPIDEEVKENFTLLVESPNFRPGEALVELNIKPPYISTTPPPVTLVSTPVISSSEPEVHMDSSVPILIPILVVVMLMVLAVILCAVFACFILQNRFHKKSSSTSAPRVHEPFSVSPSLPPTRHIGHQFTFDPQEFPNENDNRSISSGFSEDNQLPPLNSPQRSPTHSHAFPYSFSYHPHSPMYSRTRPPIAARPRVMSNVSITLSQSVMSENSIDHSVRDYSHPLSRPPQPSIAVPIPVRPSSQAAFYTLAGESGYNTSTYTGDDSRRPSRSSVIYQEEEVSLADEGFPSVLDDHVTNAGDHVTAIKVVNDKTAEIDLEEDQGVHELLDLNDPKVQGLFRSTHPVLKKQEYWF